MKAARLHELGKPLSVEEIPEPTLKPGGVIVRVLSSHIPPFTDRVLSGELGYALPPLPFTPSNNAVGVVEAIAADGADMVLDVLGGLKHPEPTMASIHALRPRGTAVFVGGVKAEIPIPYSKIMLEELTIRGAFMYPRSVPGELYKMIAAGVLDLKPIQTHTFPLDEVNEAVTQAAKSKGFDYCFIVP